MGSIKSVRRASKINATITCKFCKKFVSLDGAGMHLRMYHSAVSQQIDSDMAHKEYAARNLSEGYNA